MTENQKHEIENSNIHYPREGNNDADKNETSFYKYDKTTNTCLVIAEGNRHDDDNDEDVQKLIRE